MLLNCNIWTDILFLVKYLVIAFDIFLIHSILNLRLESSEWRQKPQKQLESLLAASFYAGCHFSLSTLQGLIFYNFEQQTIKYVSKFRFKKIPFFIKLPNMHTESTKRWGPGI